MRSSIFWLLPGTQEPFFWTKFRSHAVGGAGIRYAFLEFLLSLSGVIDMRCSMLLFLVLLTGRLLAADLPKPTGEAIVSPDAKLELLFTRSADINGGLTEG